MSGASAVVAQPRTTVLPVPPGAGRYGPAVTDWDCRRGTWAAPGRIGQWPEGA